MRKAWAFFVRDALVATSYKTSFVFQFVPVLVWVLIAYFIGEGVTPEDPEKFERYGGNYFSFMLIGLGLLGFHTISLQTFNQKIRESQLMGTLEIVLLSPTSLPQLLAYSSLWIYFWVTIRFTILLGAGALFGLDLGNGNALSALVVLLISIPAFASLGVASAAIVLVIKRGESFNLLIGSASLILAGVMFPVEVLPDWIQPLAALLPLTHSLEAIRLALFQGATVVELAPRLGVLAVFALVLLPASLASFWLAVRWTKATGTLAQY